MAELDKAILQPQREADQVFYLIAHAGGGYKGKTYLNTLEAIQNAYMHRVEFIELDFHYTSDSVIVLAHDFVNSTSEKFLSDTSTGSHLTLSMIMEWVSDKKVTIVTDIKTDNLKILSHLQKSYPKQSSKIIPQAYTISEISAIAKMGYTNIIFTNYVARYPNPIIRQVLRTEKLFAVTLPYDKNFRVFKMFDGLDGFKTPIFVHTVNDAKIVQELKREGCDGVYTDFLINLVSE